MVVLNSSASKCRPHSNLIINSNEDSLAKLISNSNVVDINGSNTCLQMNSKLPCISKIKGINTHTDTGTDTNSDTTSNTSTEVRPTNEIPKGLKSMTPLEIIMCVRLVALDVMDDQYNKTKNIVCFLSDAVRDESKLIKKKRRGYDDQSQLIGNQKKNIETSSTNNGAMNILIVQISGDWCVLATYLFSYQCLFSTIFSIQGLTSICFS